MKKESILSPQEKLVKKRKIEENRQKKQQMLQAASANSGNKTFLHPRNFTVKSDFTKDASTVKPRFKRKIRQPDIVS